MIYGLINPSDELSFEAEDHRVAICVVMMVGEGAYGARTLDGNEEKKIPLMLFGNADAYLKTWFGEDEPLDWMLANKPAVAACLRTFLYGKPDKRTENMLVGDLEASQEKKRTSINDIRGKALKLAELLMTTP